MATGGGGGECTAHAECCSGYCRAVNAGGTYCHDCVGEGASCASPYAHCCLGFYCSEGGECLPGPACSCGAEPCATDGDCCAGLTCHVDTGLCYGQAADYDCR